MASKRGETGFGDGHVRLLPVRLLPGVEQQAVRVTRPGHERPHASEVDQIRAVRPEKAALGEDALEPGQWGAHRMCPIVGMQDTHTSMSLDEPDGLGREGLMVIACRNEDA